MFGLNKPKKKKLSTINVDEIADELFLQITSARDEAKGGNIIDETVFNDRLNHMFTAGYLIGYVDQYMADIEEDESVKKEKSKLIFEKMFPGTGFDFVRAKVMSRQQAPSGAIYSGAVVAAKDFDQGLDIAQQEVESYRSEDGDKPIGLKKFLLLGEIPEGNMQ